MTSLVGAAVLGWARQGIVATLATSVVLCLLAVADLSVMGLHTPMWHRQTPRHLFLRFGPAKGAALWGLDTGLGFTTYRVTSIVWAGMVLSVFGFLPAWAGIGYAAGFSFPLILMTSGVPRRSDLPHGKGGEPGWLTTKLIASQRVARLTGALAILGAAAILLMSSPAIGRLLGTIPLRWV